MLSPIASLVLTAAQGSGEIWPHLIAHVLPQAFRDTVLLLAGVGLLVVAVGAGAAWLVAAFEFPGRRWLEVGLVLPLALPTYIAAYAYLDLLHPIGPFQSALRGALGYARPRDFSLPDIRNLPGCILLLGLVLYPYVYLPARAFFLMQAGGLIEAARSLGAPPSAVFFRIALPLARPAVALGAALALMEALNDVGAAEFLGVRTLTVQVYATWVNRSDLPGAAGIALGMLGLVLALVLVERMARRRRGYASAAQRPFPLVRRPLAGAARWIAPSALFVPVALGFLVPALSLAAAALARIEGNGLPVALAGEVLNTLRYAGAAAVLTAAVGCLVAAGPFLLARGAGGALIRVASLGYAMPGIVLGIGLLGPLSWIDGGLAEIGVPWAVVGLGSGGGLVTAYLLRFLAISVGSSEAGFARVPGSLPDAARMLGRGKLATLGRIQIPLTWPALVGGGLLVFIDCLKELPATLLLRPLNVETLATHIYGEAARGTYEDGAVAALLIVAVGLIPVALLMRVGMPAAGRVRALAKPQTV